MKRIRFKIEANIEFDLNGSTLKEVKYNLNKALRNAMKNGTFSGMTSATVEDYTFLVNEIPEPKPNPIVSEIKS